MSRTYKTEKEAQEAKKKITPASCGTPTRKLRKAIRKVKGGYRVYVYASGMKYEQIRAKAL